MKDSKAHNLSSSSSFISKTSVFPCSARVRRSSRNEAPPHIPEHCPFSMQTKHLQNLLHTFIPKSSSLYPHISPLPLQHFYRPTPNHPSPLLRSTCPNHYIKPLILPDSSVLFLNPSWLVWGRASRHQKLVPTFPGIDSCFMMTKTRFSRNGSITMTKPGDPKMLLKVDCLPNAFGKQPSIPLIDLGRKWTLSW